MAIPVVSGMISPVSSLVIIYYHYYCDYLLSPLCRVFTFMYLKQYLLDKWCCSYSVVAVHATCNATSHAECSALAQ